MSEPADLASPLRAPPAPSPPHFSWRRLLALVRKEGLQVVRDPAAILIAFVLPVILLFLFAYAVSLDIRQVPIGVVLESDEPRARALAAAFAGTRYFQVTPARDARGVAEAVAAGRLKGFVVIPADFEHRLTNPVAGPLVEILTDGSQPNNAGFVANYAQGVVAGWAQAEGLAPSLGVDLRPRFWFNPEIESRRFLIPGAIAIIMTMIGTLLTALVLAREWERGTMEALFSTPARVAEILIGKLLPYFGLGLMATLGSAALAITAFGLPLEGSWGALLLVSAVFLMPALGQGLVISAIAKNQFIAAQVALFTGFLPAFLLSGFLFEIDSMPVPIRIVTLVVPARYFIASLQTIFLAGNAWPVLIPNMAAMLAIGLVFFTLARVKTRKSLDA
jgi:ABC-2 type transport system permease protein